MPVMGLEYLDSFKDIAVSLLWQIKKSIQAAEVTNSKSSAGQTGGNPKSHLGKGLTGPV